MKKRSLNTMLVVAVAASLSLLVFTACAPAPILPTPTPLPSQTPTPTATPDPCAPANLAGPLEDINRRMNEFDDTLFRATKLRAEHAPIDQVQPVIADFQRVRGEVEAREVPSCLGQLKAYQVAYMDTVMNALFAFMLNADTESLNQGIADAKQRHEAYDSEFARLSALMPGEATPVPLPADFVDDKGVPMRLVPAGEFSMGSDDGFPDAQPAHSVYLDAYYIDKYEVTNGFYMSCVNSGVCDPPGFDRSSTRSSYYGNPEYDDYPVIYMDWNMANTYCEWRGAQLPSEAQWERAARGADGRAYPWGGEIDKLFVAYNQYVSDTVMVGSSKRDVSPYGVYDMASNVREWVADRFDVSYYQRSPSSNPPGSSSGRYRGMRGGSWGDFDASLRAFNRGSFEPTNFVYWLGLRCARPSP